RKISANSTIEALPCSSQRVHQAGHGFTGRRGGGRSEVRVEGRRSRGVVSQIVLDEAEIHPSFQQMRGIAVAQRVDGGSLMAPAGCEGRAKGVLDTITGHGSGGCSHAEAAPARRRKEPERMAVGAPVLAE